MAFAVAVAACARRAAAHAPVWALYDPAAAASRSAARSLAAAAAVGGAGVGGGGTGTGPARRGAGCARGLAAKAGGKPKQAAQQGGKKRKKVGVGGDADGARFSKALEMCLRLLKGEAPAAPELTKEELAEGERLAKEYSRRWLQKRRALVQKLNAKAALRDAAIAALPERLQAYARMPDYTPYPRARRAAAEFQPVAEEKTEEDEDKEFGFRSTKSR